jgi:hypothetical protein
MEIADDAESVVCSSCGTRYRVLTVGGTIALAPAPTDYLTELDQEITEVGSDIQELKSREQGAPLQIGCALFGVFGLVILVLAFFATLARSLFGTPLFYTALAAAIVIGLYRMRGKLIGRERLAEIRNERLQLELRLVQLEEERAEILRQREGPRRDE